MKLTCEDFFVSRLGWTIISSCLERILNYRLEKSKYFDFPLHKRDAGKNLKTIKLLIFPLQPSSTKESRNWLLRIENIYVMKEYMFWNHHKLALKDTAIHSSPNRCGWPLSSGRIRRKQNCRNASLTSQQVNKGLLFDALTTSSSQNIGVQCVLPFNWIGKADKKK